MLISTQRTSAVSTSFSRRRSSETAGASVREVMLFSADDRILSFERLSDSRVRVFSLCVSVFLFVQSNQMHSQKSSGSNQHYEERWNDATAHRCDKRSRKSSRSVNRLGQIFRFIRSKAEILTFSYLSTYRLVCS